MATFHEYFLMKAEDAADYARANGFFDAGARLTCDEIGDGNLNYVFRVQEPDGRSVIIKQAGDTARISEDFKLSTDRNRIESEILTLEGRLAPGLVPAMLKYDSIMNCCVMEDLSDHTIMRDALLRHETFPLFAGHITTFMVNTLLLTSDVALEHKRKKDMVKRYINPELCEITEDLVYTEPFNDYKSRNILFEPNADWINREIYGDRALRLEAAKLKLEFMSNAQALIHGDLHTGSIFVKQDSTKVIDPEFAFYGPMGYDVGNIIANLYFAYVNGRLTIADPAAQAAFTGWVADTVETVIELFKEKFLRCFHENAADISWAEDGFAEWYLDTVLRDTAAAAGLELTRRIIGMAKVKDITTIGNAKDRIAAERFCLTIAKELIKQRECFKSGADFRRLTERFDAARRGL